MLSRYVVIGIVVGVFIAGLAIGNMISQSDNRPTMMQNTPISGPMGWIDPSLPHTWMKHDVRS
jgi:hypothetical protein